jgi:hypothetical protein
MRKARIAAVGGYIYSHTLEWMQSGLKSKGLEAVGGAHSGCHNVSQAHENEQISKPIIQVKTKFKKMYFFPQ